MLVKNNQIRKKLDGMGKIKGPPQAAFMGGCIGEAPPLSGRDTAVLAM